MSAPSIADLRAALDRLDKRTRDLEDALLAERRRTLELRQADAESRAGV